MPTRVFLLRHAETADPSVFHGAESDVGLSERGRRQAEAVANVLGDCGVEWVVSSAMRRAMDTAGPIARTCAAPLRIEPLLHERRIGILTGTPTGGSDGVWPQTLRRWLAGETGFAPDGAESYDAIRARVLPTWERLMDEGSGRTLVVVAHGVVCKVLLVNLLHGLGLADWQRLGPVRNGSFSELIRAEAGWQAVRLNELPPAVQNA
jgi:2,3-bisphosphoglycerate-dependent phosphoglycerate mutase